MKPFEFYSAENQASALQTRGPLINGSENTSRFLAGGTTLVDLMKLEVEQPSIVVDISNLPLKEIRDTTSATAAALEIGALVSNSDLAHHPWIKKNIPVLSEAILSGASPQLRNLATTSGNLLQRTRCSYFRDPATPCNKREPGSGCSAIGGYDRALAVLGTSSSCIASHPSDMCVAMMALDAIILTSDREIPIHEFYTLPADHPEIENILKPHELITGVRILKKNWFRKSTYVKVRDRTSYAFALSSAAVALDLVGRTVRNVRIALGGVGTVPWRSPEAERVLSGEKLTMEKAQQAAKAALADARPGKHNSFKIQLAQQTLIRALHQIGDLS
jgi:xanthine dehydrogenase YagS FAD-binding subunit